MTAPVSEIRVGRNPGRWGATVKERGILFSAPLVRALLAGTKTQTRRLLKPQPTRTLPNEQPLPSPNGDPWTIYRGKGWRWQKSKSWSSFVADEAGHNAFAESLANFSPYGVPGDRLWVREAFALSIHDPETLEPDAKVERHWDPPIYRADGEEQGGGWTDGEGNKIPPPWRSPLYMPRWASRITLEVTEVRVQRLQEISEEDALDEGISREGLSIVRGSARQRFAELWDRINGAKAPWSSNPWVWCVSFKKVESDQ